ncbi:MATE family efflux transporter [Brasilonema octagenarum UFV-E1]|uniref:Probable multidrug resistance protein NorM n=2 Tax=Brasilonema TaxID=383614 RepID=A0A856MBQ2_9CYAN|nr:MULTISPECIES: MATE family efflux transporter [Brasilonema]NMF63600.1 MATE family efflux transporter [Brasilonema octagenarum UFV-OR1]QDL08112.1 MATE family efflux transporter [Brasilonema sennae CENA114]QDL14472.1 MATE family efflux transporter [Brasilonema octagenarum UFV-E1]
MQIASTQFKSELLSEALKSLRLIVPLVITQISDTAINAIDVVMMGLLGAQSLAGGALGAIAFSTSVYVVYGICSGVGAMAAKAFGASKTDQIDRVTCHGLWLAGAISIPVMLLIWHCDSLLLLSGQERSNVLLAQTYSRALVWGFPAAIGVLILKDVASAVNHPRFIAAITIFGMFLNIPLNYVMMFGKFGFPHLGLAGIGWASSIVFWVNFSIAFALFSFHPNFKDYKFFDHLYQFDKSIFVTIFQTGWSMGIHFGAEIALLNVTVWLMGYLGTEVLTAHQIAIQTVEIFMAIPAAITSATTARVGQRLGEKDLFGVKRAASIGITFGAVFSFVVALICWLFPDHLVAIYLDINNVDNTEAIKIAISFLKLAALYQIAYGIQMIAVGALLGLQDTRIPMLINLLTFWGIGLGGGYFMGLNLVWGGIGLWWGLILGPAISAVILVWRFYSVISQKLANCSNEDRDHVISSQPLDDIQASIS